MSFEPICKSLGKRTDDLDSGTSSSPECVRDISERVYRIELGPVDTARMIAKDKDNGEKLRNRAKSYDSLTRSYLKALGIDS